MHLNSDFDKAAAAYNGTITSDPVMLVDDDLGRVAPDCHYTDCSKLMSSPAGCTIC